MYENNTIRSLNPCYTNCIFKTLNKPVFNNFYNFFRKISNNNISKLRNLPQSVIWSWVISARATDRLAKTKKILPTILSSLPLSLSLCVWVLTDSTSVFMRISREIIQNCLFFCSLVIMEDCLYGPCFFLACHILFYFHKVIKVMKKETFKINFFQEKKKQRSVAKFWNCINMINLMERNHQKFIAQILNCWYMYITIIIFPCTQRA